MTLYPLQFEPISKYRIWGGKKLNTVLNKGFNGEIIGESWEISNVKGDETLVRNGLFKGKTLQELAQQFKGELVGNKVYKTFGDNFPLLIKFIDAEKPLSIQVHPHDDVAKKRHSSFGKNEMWYIMDADEDAEIFVGFNQKLTQQEYLSHLKNNTVLKVLNKVNTKTGDAFNIPTGRVHAIGAGVLLAEIQQTSDVTYRIFDYNRVDLQTGQERELHNDLALDVIDFEVQESYTANYQMQKDAVAELIHTPYFTSNILEIQTQVKRDYSSIDSFVILICVEGSLELNVEGENYRLTKGETLLLPAVVNKVEFSAEANAKLIEVYL